MRITILVNKDLHSNIALNLLLPALDSHELTVFMSEKVGAPSADYRMPDDLSQLKYLEQNLFNEIISPLLTLQHANTNRYLCFEEIGKLLGKPPQLLANANSSESLELLAASKPDLVLSIRYGSILREQAIALPRLGVLNLHSGLLPRYKGIMTTLHSLLEDQPEVGCTLHRIDSPDIDAGPIIAKASITVDSSHSLLWHILQLYPLGCQLIVSAVELLARDEELPAVVQSTSNTAYFSLPMSADFTRLKDKGYKVWEPADIDSLYAMYITPDI